MYVLRDKTHILNGTFLDGRYRKSKNNNSDKTEMRNKGKIKWIKKRERREEGKEDRLKYLMWIVEDIFIKCISLLLNVCYSDVIS